MQAIKRGCFESYCFICVFFISVCVMAMYKNRNTGTGNRMRGMRGMGVMLYSGECSQIFLGISSNIPGNVAKYSGECRKTFGEMS